MTTTCEIVDAINNLQSMLQKQYGCDYAYTILAKGEVIAASNSIESATPTPLPSDWPHVADRSY